METHKVMLIERLENPMPESGEARATEIGRLVHDGRDGFHLEPHEGVTIRAGQWVFCQPIPVVGAEPLGWESAWWFKR